LQGLFLAALLGVLLAVGVGVVALTGWIGGAAYSVVLGGLLAAAISRRPREQAHQGCDCCAKAAAEPAPAGTIKL
jgi:hypothetical protein